MTPNFRRFLVLSVFVLQFSWGQTNKENYMVQEFPFTSEHWRVENADSSDSDINTRIFKNKPALELRASQVAYLYDTTFKNFRMEFYCNGSYPGLGFRIQDKKNYEYLYLRVPSGGKRDALQYIPIFNGSLPWQLYNYPKYEGIAPFPLEKVAVFPQSIEEMLVEGKVSEELRQLLESKSISFSSEAEVIYANEALRYIYEPKDKNGLLFSKVGETIEFSDPRTWIHTKVEVIGNEMSIYVEDMNTPTFVVANLKRNAKEGGISLVSDFGEVYFSEVSIQELKKSNETKNKTPEENLSANYITKWKMSEMFAKDSVNFVSQLDSLFINKGKFKAIEADADGLLNISRFYDDMTKTVVLTHNLESDADNVVKLNFDYADHLIVFLNSRLLFDKGMNFAAPDEKGEEGRVFVNDESVELDLKKGKNELIFMLSADNRQKFNWGFIAKLQTMEGITIE